MTLTTSTLHHATPLKRVAPPCSTLQLPAATACPDLQIRPPIPNLQKFKGRLTSFPLCNTVSIAHTYNTTPP